MDHLDFNQKQTLLRLVVEQVRVTGWNVEIRLRIPLDDEPESTPPPEPPEPNSDHPEPLSSEDRLRSLGGRDECVLPRDGRGPLAFTGYAELSTAAR